MFNENLYFQYFRGTKKKTMTGKAKDLKGRITCEAQSNDVGVIKVVQKGIEGKKINTYFTNN